MRNRARPVTGLSWLFPALPDPLGGVCSHPAGNGSPGAPLGPGRGSELSQRGSSPQRISLLSSSTGVGVPRAPVGSHLGRTGGSLCHPLCHPLCHLFSLWVHLPFPGGFSSLSVPWTRFKPSEMGLTSQLCSGLAQSRCLVTSAHLGTAGPGWVPCAAPGEDSLPCVLALPCSRNIEF